MMFHPKHVLIKYEFQKHRMDHQSDILLRAAKKFWLFKYGSKRRPATKDRRNQARQKL